MTTTQSVVLAFDGKDDFISLPAMKVDYSKGITVEAWVFYNSFKHWSRVIDLGNGVGQDNLVFANYGSTNSLAISIRQGGNEQQLLAEGTLETGKWIHVAMVVDAAGNGRLYKNGQEVKSGKMHLPLSINRTLNYIGKSAWPNDGYFDGYMADVRLWNVARSSAEIMKDMVCLGFATGEAGLVGYWPLNDGTGNIAADKSGNGNHGTANGATWQQQQLPVQVQISQTQTTTQTTFQVITYLVDKAYSLNGTSDFLQIESNDAINFGTNENFTISVWIQPEAEQKYLNCADNDVVEKWSTGTPYPYVIRYINQTNAANGTIMVARYDGNNNPVINSKTKINDGKFHHVVFARTTENGKGKLSLYIDGKLEGTTDDTTTGETKNNSPLFIGRRGGNHSNINYFRGSVKELSFFKSSLSIEQIQQISTGVSITSLIEKWSTTVVTVTPSETIIVGPGGIYKPQEPTVVPTPPIVGPGGIYRPQEPTIVPTPPIVGPGGIYRPVKNQPVAYYPLNGNAQDASGNNVHGAEKGKISYAAGRIEQAAVFDGGSHIEIDDPFKNTTEFTIALWLRPTAMNDGGYHGFIGKQGDAYRKPGMWVSPANSGLHYDSYSMTGQRFDCLLNNFFEAKDVWVHVTWVKQGTEYRIYRNGELFATKPAPENFYTAKSSYWIGRVDNFFVGQIDDVRIYNVPLSVDEIKGIIGSSLDAGLIAYYPLNGNAQDFSGNGCHGTEQNITYVAGRMGQAASFNGASSVITATLPKVKKTYTVSMFAKFNNINKENQLFYLTRAGQTDRLGYLSTYPAGQKTWHFGSRRYGQGWEDRGTTVPDAQGMQINKWYHLAFVLNDQEISLFVDGTLAKTIKSTQPSDIEANSNLLFMLGGTTEKYQWMEGAIDEVRVYNRVLAVEEIKSLATGNYSPATQVGKIVVNADEWTLGNAGFQNAPDAAVFVANVAKWFVGNRAGKFHAFSTNFGLTESLLADAMKKAGHTWTVGTNIKFDLATVSTYDGIFLSGDAADNQVLIDYVKAGGNVYLAAGTGWGGPQAEADRWNKFLEAFGLKFTGQYNGIGGSQAITSTHPIFTGVKALYQNNGNSIVDLEPTNPLNQIVVTHTSGQGLFAVYEGKKPAVTVGTTYLIRSKLHGFVLDITGSNREPRTPIISYPLNGATGTPNQQWRFVPVPGSEGTYLISSVLNNFVIDITGGNTAPVTPVIAYPTNGQNGTPNQHWELVPVPNTENTFLIKTKLNGFVLDIEGSNQAAGARVISYPVNGAIGTPNQHWELVVV